MDNIRDNEIILKLMYENIDLMIDCFKDLIGTMYSKRIINGLESLSIDNFLDHTIPHESSYKSTWTYKKRIDWLKKQANIFENEQLKLNL